MKLTISILAFICLLFTATSFAQPGEEEQTTFDEESANIVEEEQPVQLITTSPDAVVASLFPRYADAKLPLGKYLELLIGFKNIGEKTFNVTYVTASLRYTADPTIFIQNFTAWRYFTLVRTGEQFSFLYDFKPDELLEPKDYLLVSTIYYTDEDNYNFTSTIYNNTVYLVEEAIPLDFQSFFSYFLTLTIAGLLAYVVYGQIPAKKKKFIPSSILETGTKDKTQVDNDWLSDSTVGDWKKNKNKMSGSSPKKGASSPKKGGGKKK